MEVKPVHYFLWQLGPGGMELSVKHYCDNFAGRRKLYAYSLRPVAVRIFDESKIEVKSGSIGKLLPYLLFFRYCFKHKKDIFHLQNGGPIILLLVLLAGVKDVVYHIHGTIYFRNERQKLYLKPAWRLARKLMQRTKVDFVANSQYSASIFKKEVFPVDATVIYNGLDVEHFAEKKWQRTQLRRIGFIGRLYTGKNVDLVIRLFETYARKCPDVELHIAGDGSLRRALEKQARKTGLANRIKFHGFVNDISSFYASIDLFLFLSAYESFGNVVAEAILTGLPTLTSNVPVFQEIFGNNNNFVLGDPHNFDAVKQQFLKVIEDFPGLASKTFDLSNTLEEKFSIAQHVSQIERIYEKH